METRPMSCANVAHSPVNLFRHQPVDALTRYTPEALPM
jgi:hypothetical protein